MFSHAAKLLRLVGRREDKAALPIFVIFFHLGVIFSDLANDVRCRCRPLARRLQMQDHPRRVRPFSANGFRNPQRFGRRRGEEYFIKPQGSPERLQIISFAE